VRLAAIAFLAGVVIFQQLPALPDGRWAVLLCISLPLSILIRPLKIPFWLVNGFLFTLLHASVIFSTSLAPELEGRELILQGVIDDLPQQLSYGQRFLLRLEQPAEGLPAKVRLGWYDRHAARLQVGQRWQFKVKLKQPHGYMNPGGFDYEGWLFRHAIRATGYVRNGPENRYLGDVQGIGYAIDRQRARLADAIDAAMPGSEFRGVVQALAIGQRQDISPAQWQVLLKTGTNHLMAISGLHVGLVAGLAFFLLRWLWSRSARLIQLWPAQKAAALAAILAALGYAALAGFSIPTQRALIMVAVLMLSLILQRFRRPSDGLLLALLLVLLLDPLAVMDAGFWLSFAAVAVILFGLSGRISMRGVWWKWGRVHLLLAIALLPLTLLLFQKASLISPVANLIAVPLVSLLVVPLVLLGVLSLPIVPSLGEWLLALVDRLLHLLWFVLEWLAAVPAAQVYHAFSPVWLAAALLGALWLLAPRGWPGRWLGGCWLMTAFLLPQARPQAGEAWFTLLDVGQGLAAVVQTKGHTLVFDTGPKLSQDFNTGEAVVVPFLVAGGIDHVDTLVVSHGDNDHIGGAWSLLGRLPVTRVLTSVPERLPEYKPDACLAGQQWRWDGVDFRMLNPADGFVASENNASCVLRVSTTGGSLLLSADIERRAERILLRKRANELHADVLVVPHHGSKTSSTDDFVRAVSPHWALIPAGYRNRFKLPRHAVVDRYLTLGAGVLQSGREGAISLRLGRTGITPPSGYRETNRRYWSHFAKQDLVLSEK
jgi:competence protein ComEC